MQEATDRNAAQSQNYLHPHLQMNPQEKLAQPEEESFIFIFRQQKLWKQ
jgi:hypothetical protein